jgi:hypothetical protein
MKSDVIEVSSKGAKMEAALKQADKVAVYKEMSPKNAMHLHLLTEEMMGLMRSITGDVTGKFWINDDEEGVYELHLQVEKWLTSETREKLLAASTTGKNSAAKGLMGRLRNFFEVGADEDIAAYTNPLVLPGMYETSSTPRLDWEWSMVQYEEALASSKPASEEKVQEARDELEKSVVAHVADDVKVSIKGRTVEMIIIKKMA